ncbi:SDR family NAD(P)-dependent oxidoreductase [Gemmatimonas sp.]|jgi:NAD(P)-dependent dehydrogenase (short-subunit alcohol dehydrogenase family)|uniref:SDR family NAD(P)-dependent oxidoreductase n=1 Tax=Gemmatimonas sp. TaxID=1962908 RepID=UPI0031BC2EEF|nr:SDR family oxidoreductase [Gemmatimonas sp.]
MSLRHESHAFSLAGKTILVTGASSGLGRQTAISCSRMGAQLVISGRSEERLQETFAALEGAGHDAIRADLTIAHERDALVARMPPLHGVVHAAGVQRLSPIKMLSETLLREVFDINFVAPVMLTQRLLYHAILVPASSIVFITSISARAGTAGVGPYAASKAALHGMMRCLALEQAKRRVRVNCVVPSAVETPLWDDRLLAQAARHPLGVGTADDVANATIYLLADASRWITGTELVMDGGAVAVS